eukprot:2361545-Amphidinium_carterae.1
MVNRALCFGGYFGTCFFGIARHAIEAAVLVRLHDCARIVPHFTGSEPQCYIGFPQVQLHGSTCSVGWNPCCFCVESKRH